MLVPFSSMPDHSRLWVYSSEAFFENGESERILQYLNPFLKEWTAHSQELKTAAKIDLDRHVLIAVDESGVKASGCSIDSCVHFLTKLGQQLDKNFFDRLNYTYLSDDKRPFMVHHHALSEAFEKGVINEDTLFADPLVKNVGDYKSHFIKPLKRSFHAQFVDKLETS